MIYMANPSTRGHKGMNASQHPLVIISDELCETRHALTFTKENKHFDILLSSGVGSTGVGPSLLLVGHVGGLCMKTEAIQG